jgi:hypothetical protein
MTNLKRRLQSLERPRSGAVQKRLLLVASGVCGPLNLATSTCTRTLWPTGALMEVVHLDGDQNGLSNEDLERFISGFPIQRRQ